MTTLDEVLEQWIPYRLQAIKTFQFAWQWMDKAGGQRHLQVIVDEHPVINGNVAAVANPMLEVGLMHARALLEFLGLGVSKGRLVEISGRRPGDIAIEHYSTPQGPLTKVHPDCAVASYPGPRDEAEGALIAIIESANKYVGHITDGAFTQAWTDRHLDIACRGIPVLLHNHLYAKLGREVPDPPIGIRVA